MAIKYYNMINSSNWTGRIDNEKDYDSFRWHQWVEVIDLNNKDLQAFQGDLAFAFLGFCSDHGVELNKGRTGSAQGPQSIRKELAKLPCSFPENVKLFDAGNISCQDCSLDEAQETLGKAVERILDLNLFPILLGGGHEIAFGHYQGVLNKLNKQEEKPNIGIINIDSHFDLRPYSEGGNSGTMFRQIADLNQEKGLDYSYFCLGIQEHSNTNYLFKVADSLGVEYILAKDIIHGDYISLLEKIDSFIKDQDYIYLTLCSDVFSSAFAPGVSAPQPLGLDPRDVLVFLKYILRSDKVVSFDVAEVSPRFDQDNTTANLASVMIFSVVKTLSQLL